jgi:hypothetical protein
LGFLSQGSDKVRIAPAFVDRALHRDKSTASRTDIFEIEGTCHPHGIHICLRTGEQSATRETLEADNFIARDGAKPNSFRRQKFDLHGPGVFAFALQWDSSIQSQWGDDKILNVAVSGIEWCAGQQPLAGRQI